MTNADDFEVLVIGGGPAGATVAAILAGEYGRRVLVLEKERFPRYHIGESLIPHCYGTLERLGLVETMNERGFQKKESVQFVSPDGEVSTPFYFRTHTDHPMATTWQVERAEFDDLMLNRAREAGAEVREGVRVRNFIEEEGQVCGVLTDEGEFRARLVVDATGRDALWQSKKRWRKRDPELNKIAIWTRFKGAKRDPGVDEGATTIAYVPEKGWFWNIPLSGDVVSSGVVAERDYLYRDGERDLAKIFWREVRENKWVEEHLEAGEQFGEYWVTGEYSYRGESCAADGLLLVGDAFAFLDPVFSSGVYLALKSGEMGADAVEAALQKGSVRAEEFAAYGERLCQGIEWMRKLVYAFYDEDFSFKDVVMNYAELRGKLTDCLIGDLVDRDYADLFAAVGNYADLPAELAHGRVRTGSSV